MRILVAASALAAVSVFPANQVNSVSQEPVESGKLVLETLAGKIDTRSLPAVEGLRFSADGVVFLRYEGARAIGPAPAASVELLDGQRWSGDVVGAKGDALRWKSSVGPELSLSIDQISCLEFHGRLSSLDRAALEPAPEADRLYWLHGEAVERIDGTFEAFSDEGIRLDGVLGRRTFPWAEVGALFVAAFESPAPANAPAGAQLLLDLADGSRLRAGFQTATPRALVLNYPGLERLVIPYEALLEAALDDGSFHYLSTLAPVRAQEGSLFGDDLGLRWPHRVDRSVVGTELSVAGRVFARGLGVHAPSRLEWKLDALEARPRALQAGLRPAVRARELCGWVGIDDSVRSTSARGCVRFQVIVDGALRWDSGLIRGGEAAVAMPRIDLRTAKELALVVDPAEDSFVADRADWLRLILIAGP